ncbi:23S rRNA (pseudouridine(1915)-N(3))-methyltransferase RlmH [Alkalilimnicola sp. S0819]|uniref:23S rRNA (pseudouridine(1915)-N(3))-methyltransferase RlmH n=1 Tax=Alkalilimnicola sp. S0819 TaxID=2613922 RepID=UPI0012618A5D|nr:23S rRNA (pseudouridine(1915)-N(3))-methyltransferase RlmH [Alkalilimnicola sp. S0819]KAB7628267.1 23S rRNA (pseudouridine(1915)-N(3))-methyltransferase RlmH [Alkalilimnicola sp. S0819]MPQ15162.1 23S rRNA (pseudouridine(1915)-N(3))-methyltransferase RlmH [Alkalilimnicola sp. S0819]
MRLLIISPGGRMPAWVAEGFRDYANRMPPQLRLELMEIALAKRGKNADLRRARDEEGARMLAAVPEQARVVALDVQGKPWSTEQLATRLQDWLQDGRDIALLVGGPDGLSPGCLARAEARWSLSALTLPHMLVRVLLAEQLYRAWTVTENHPYHRA